jgi:hypothetical protein
LPLCTWKRSSRRSSHLSRERRILFAILGALVCCLVVLWGKIQQSKAVGHRTCCVTFPFLRADAWWTKARDLQKILHHLGRVIFGDFCAVLGMSLCNNDECHCTFSIPMLVFDRKELEICESRQE